MKESLMWLVGEGGGAGVIAVEKELDIPHDEIHEAAEIIASMDAPPGTRLFADLAGTAHLAFEWGVRWQRERERG